MDLKPILMIIVFISVAEFNISVQQTRQYVNIERTTPQVIFQPLGKLVTQFSYGTIKIHINVTSLYDEINDLCKAAKLLIVGTRKLQKVSNTRNYIHSMTSDIKQSCVNSVRKLDGITKTFGFTTHNVPEHIPDINKINLVKRPKRQLVIAAIALVSIISIYSASQLTSIAGSNENDLISNQNHIISAIQDENNRICRYEDNIKHPTNHIKELEKELLIMNDIESTFIKILGIKTQPIAITNHLQEIEVGLYNLIKGQLTPHLVSTTIIQEALDRLKNNIANNGYSLGTNKANEAFQAKASFVLYTNGKLLALLHIPIYKIQTSLSAYKYVGTPLMTQQNKSTLTIEPKKSILDIGMSNDLHLELTEVELEHNCQFIKDMYY